MLSTKIAAPVTVLLAVLSIAAFAQNQPTGQNQPTASTVPTAEEIIKKVREKYRFPRSYETAFTKTVEFKRERNGLVYESKVQTSAIVWEELPDRLRVEARDSEYEVVKVVDGRIQWLYSPDFKMYVKREADAEGRPPRAANEEWRFDNLASEAGTLIRQYASAGEAVRGAKQVISLLREETVESGGQKLPCYVIELNQALPDKSDFKRLLWVEKDSFLVRRESSTRNSQTAQAAKTVSTTTYNFGRIVLNEPLAARLFVFDAPSDAKAVAVLNPFAPKTPVAAVAVGKEAPDFTLKDLTGKAVNLQALRGKTVLLNFWATWCGPCRVEMPHLEKLYREYKDKDVVFLTVSDEEPDVIRAFLLGQKYTFGSLVDEDSQASRLYQINAIPQTVFIGRSGRVVESFRGTHEEKDFRAAIEKMLKATDDAQLKVAQPPVIAKDAMPCVPKLQAPKSGAVLPNGGGKSNASWDFSWSGCPDAARYHLQIKGQDAKIPLYEYAALHSLTYRYPLRQGYISDANLKDWTWRVRCQVNGQWSEWSEGRFDVEPLKAEAVANLPAPKLTSPADKSVFDFYPRKTVLVWEAVSGAAGYRIEIDFSSQGIWSGEQRGTGGQVVETKETTYTHMFVGAQPGRWRVWAVDAEGRAGPKSPWWGFSYTR